LDPFRSMVPDVSVAPLVTCFGDVLRLDPV